MELPPPYSPQRQQLSQNSIKWINGTVPLADIKLNTKNYILEQAIDEIVQALPILTVETLDMIFTEHGRSKHFDLGPITTILGILVLPKSILKDTFRAVVYPVRAAATAVYGIANHLNIKSKAEQKVIDVLVNSFKQRFEATLSILMSLNIETPESLHRHFKDGYLDIYLTLTLLFTALASCKAESGCICTASGHVLSLDNCPKVGIPMFNDIHNIKEELILLEVPNTTNETIETIDRWIPTIIDVLKNPNSNTDDRHPNLNRVIKLLLSIKVKINKILIDKKLIDELNSTPITLLQRRR